MTDDRYFDGLPVNKPLCSRYDGGYANPSYKDPNSLNDRISFADYIGAEVYRDNYVFIESDPNKQEGNYNSGFPYHGGVSYGTNLGTVSKDISYNPPGLFQLRGQFNGIISACKLKPYFSEYTMVSNKFAPYFTLYSIKDPVWPYRTSIRY